MKLKNIFKTLTILTAVGGALFLYLLNKTSNELDTLDKEVTYASSEVKAVSEKKQPISVLLIGIDEWEDDRRGAGENTLNRSDALMVASINPETKTTELVSIPRDTLVEIKGENREGILDKVNHAHAYGGVDQTIATVSNYLDIPINYYAKINMTGLEELVDAVGGVGITPGLTFNQSGYQFNRGEYKELKGSEALAYARMRKQDPKGDVGRGERQQEIVKALIKKTATAEGVKKYREVLNAVGSNLETNIPINIKMILGYYKSFDEFNVHSLEGQEDLRVNNVYYLGVHDEYRKEIVKVLRNNLELSESTVDHSDYLRDARLGNLRRR